MHCVIKLVSKDFRCSYNDRSVRVFLTVSGEDAAIFMPEFMAEFLIDGIGEGFKG
ncbi:MAG: hypothetical protein GY864_13835 [Desulfobacterales bacterium]|nr:hypothetical protein [Desulfobacterales bacterium]